MNDAPRRTLRELIARHGPGLCGDARRCEGLLRDLCGEHRREINILVGALRERVPLDLLAGRNSVPAGLLLTRLSKRLEDHLALTEDASRWAVDSWALALGVVSDGELDGLKSRRDESTPPRTGAAPTTAAPRPAAEAEPPARKPAASPATTPPSKPPRTRPSVPPTPTPPASNPSGTRPTATVPTRPSARVGPTASATHYPAPPATRTPSSAQVTNAGGLQEPSADVAARGGRGRRRGCLIGCFLILLLSVLLAAGAPFVINILREEQQQRNLEPPPVQTR
jgi:hypothetical protein